MDIIVCGGRDYADRDRLFAELDALHAEVTVTRVITGQAPGADTLAAEWARSRTVPLLEIPADWTRYGKGAGHVRNGWMLEEEPERVVAFPGGRGTADMIRQAEAAGVPVRRIEETPE